MKFWNKVLLILFAVFLTLPVFSENIVFSCMQNPDAYENSNETTVKFEELLFDCFFESGLIASNVPLLSIAEANYNDINIVKKTLESPTEYVLLIYFSYAKEPVYSSKDKAELPDLKSVSWILLDYQTEKTIYDKNIKVKTAKSEKDVYKQLKKIAKNISGKVSKKIH
ncbi:MAG: hypothetical protein CR988_05440 [Treponema sp.]|nr:MAG: hypothetical protein CR988_05440 [Treponema sp.]